MAKKRVHMAGIFTVLTSLIRSALGNPVTVEAELFITVLPCRVIRDNPFVTPYLPAASISCSMFLLTFLLHNCGAHRVGADHAWELRPGLLLRLQK